eukprot:4777722-Amphidinium_carterae.1
MPRGSSPGDSEPKQARACLWKCSRHSVIDGIALFYLADFAAAKAAFEGCCSVCVHGVSSSQWQYFFTPPRKRRKDMYQSM